MTKLLILLLAASTLTALAEAHNPVVSAQDSAEQYAVQIEQQSALLGPFDPSLAELYHQQGLALQRSGHLSDAVQKLQLALQVNRVNHGLHSKQQEPVLRALINIASNIGEQGDITLLHDRLLDINNHILANNPSIDDVPLLLDSSRWHFEQYMQLRSTATLPQLRRSLLLSDAAQKIVSQHYNPQHTELIEPLQQITEASLYLTTYYLTELRFFGSRGSKLHDQLTELVFQQGLKAHRQIVKIHKNNQSPPQQIAQAQIALGDFLQRLQLLDASHKVYKRAWKTLHNANDQNNLDNWLGQPVPLFSKHSTTVADASAVARIRADITPAGEVENIEILETHPAQSDRIAKVARRAARGITFRNAVINGEIAMGTVEFNLPLK